MTTLPTTAVPARLDSQRAPIFYTLTVRDRFNAMVLQMSGPNPEDQETLLTAYQRRHSLTVLRRDGYRWQLSNGDTAEIVTRRTGR